MVFGFLFGERVEQFRLGQWQLIGYFAPFPFTVTGCHTPLRNRTLISDNRKLEQRIDLQAAICMQLERKWFIDTIFIKQRISLTSIICNRFNVQTCPQSESVSAPAAIHSFIRLFVDFFPLFNNEHNNSRFQFISASIEKTNYRANLIKSILIKTCNIVHRKIAKRPRTFE